MYKGLIELCEFIYRVLCVKCVLYMCRYNGNRHVSMGAEKWLDIEFWDTPKECFKVLKSRGYRIATTHLGMDTVNL